MAPGVGLTPCGVDGTEQIEGLGAGAAWFGMVDDELLAGRFADVESLVGESEGADVRVKEVFGVPGLAALSQRRADPLGGVTGGPVVRRGPGQPATVPTTPGKSTLIGYTCRRTDAHA